MATLQQREELHRTIWSMADELRGAVGGWEFKAYVLGTLFYRFISENLTDYINNLQHEAGVDGFDYALMNDEDAKAARAQMVQEKGFFILPSQLFANVCKNCENDENLNMTLSNTFKAIEASAIGTESDAVHDACYIYENDLDPMFVSYFLRSGIYHLQIKSNVVRGKICSISSDGIGKALIPVFPMDKQKEIVKNLLPFEDLLENLEQQLAYRQKQYEYYRNQFLTFE